jgi:hypothetical protein
MGGLLGRRAEPETAPEAAAAPTASILLRAVTEIRDVDTHVADDVFTIPADYQRRTLEGGGR